MYIKTNWNTGNGKKTKILWRGKYQKGEWTDWEVRAKWSNASDGYIQIWKDNKKIVDRQGPNTHHDHSGGIYMKAGIYKYSWKRSPEKSNTDARVIYVDNVRISSI